MTTIITITAARVTFSGENYHDYTDRILFNIMTDNYEVLYSGQNQGKYDIKLIDSVEQQSEFRIYYRKKVNTPFTYLGSTNISCIIQERIVPNGTNSIFNERLQIRLIILAENVINRQINTEFEGMGKYKKSVLQHNNFNINGKNLCLGFYKE
jgi:hypothetical protein